MFHIPWVVLPAAVKIFLLGMYALAFIAVVRFARLALRLYRYTGDAVVPENIVKGTVDPSLLATFALASRSLCKSVLPKCINREGFEDAAAEQKAPLMLRMADSRFSYLWETCAADVESGKRASLLILLLSVAMVGFGAFGTFYYFCEGTNVGAYQCLFQMADQLLVLFAFGTSICAMLYFVSSFFERALSRRKTCWKYFSATLKNNLSR